MAWCFSTRASVATVLTTHTCVSRCLRVNTLRPRQNGHHFADDTFKWIFLNENIRISIKTSLKFVPGGSINNIPALVQIMAWHRPGDKPLSEPMMIILLTHICVTRPQWVNSLWPSDTIWQHRSMSTPTQVMAKCWMTTPSHYLHQCWLIISKFDWHSSAWHFTRYPRHQSLKLLWKLFIWNFIPISQGAMS